MNGFDIALEQAFIASTRFGFGPLPGELRAIAGDPRGWRAAQLDDPKQPKSLRDLPEAAQLTTQTLRKLGEGVEPYTAFLRRDAVAHLRKEAGRRTAAAIDSDAPFVERLVQFWGNHFTVSSKRFQIIASAGAFEREALRPRVTGSFADMLLASTKHPVMLAYLDNAVSFGPNSMAGVRRGVGLNKNLAREILELHTLGVNGGYGQDDVFDLAKILTGWGIARPIEPAAKRSRRCAMNWKSSASGAPRQRRKQRRGSSAGTSSRHPSRAAPHGRPCNPGLRCRRARPCPGGRDARARPATERTRYGDGPRLVGQTAEVG
ncbi:MAG: DUF1800 family protein [Alphaproteobacteria bacterium]|nr:DUF1800 family protein [Alphaproteobacteria bacterium]